MGKDKLSTVSMLIAIHSLGNYRESTKAQSFTVKATEQLMHGYTSINHNKQTQREKPVRHGLLVKVLLLY